MPPDIPRQMIDDELHAVGAKPTVYAVQAADGYPFLAIGDRQFEILLYLVCEEDIRNKRLEPFDLCSLMQGTSDRGRDVALRVTGKNGGIVQCKLYAGRVSKPLLAREILKFALHAVLDETLVQTEEFVYVLAAPELTEPADELLGPGEKLLKDPDLGKWAGEVIREFEAFSGLSWQAEDGKRAVEAAVRSLIGRFRVEARTKVDLTARLKRYHRLVAHFFEVEKVISGDAATLEGKLDDVMKILGSRGLSDEYLDRLSRRVRAAPEHRRFNLGLISFLGYDKGVMAQLLGDPDARALLMQSSVLKLHMDLKVLDLLLGRGNDLVVAGISSRDDISPFTKQACAPYVLSAVFARYIEGTTSPALLEAMRRKHGKLVQQRLPDIRRVLLEAGARTIAGDFSRVVGEGSFLREKIEILKWTHSGFSSEAELAERFDSDWPLIKPALDEIVDDLLALVPDSSATIVIEDGAFLEDRGHLESLLKAMLPSADIASLNIPAELDLNVLLGTMGGGEHGSSKENTQLTARAFCASFHLLRLAWGTALGEREAECTTEMLSVERCFMALGLPIARPKLAQTVTLLRGSNGVTVLQALREALAAKVGSVAANSFCLCAILFRFAADEEHALPEEASAELTHLASQCLPDRLAEPPTGGAVVEKLAWLSKVGAEVYRRLGQ